MRDLLGSAVVALFSVSLLIGAASFACAEQFTNEGIPPKSTSQYLRSHFQHLRTHAELHFDRQKSELHLVQDVQKCLPDTILALHAPIMKLELAAQMIKNVRAWTTHQFANSCCHVQVAQASLAAGQASDGQPGRADISTRRGQICAPIFPAAAPWRAHTAAINPPCTRFPRSSPRGEISCPRFESSIRRPEVQSREEDH
jgi:hypothetical protein